MAAFVAAFSFSAYAQIEPKSGDKHTINVGCLAEPDILVVAENVKDTNVFWPEVRELFAQGRCVRLPRRIVVDLIRRVAGPEPDYDGDMFEIWEVSDYTGFRAFTMIWHLWYPKPAGYAV